MFQWLRDLLSPLDGGPKAAYEEFRKFEDDLLATGWQMVEFTRPPDNETVEFIRRGWDEPIIDRFGNFHPATNVANLWWRPLGNIIDVTPVSAPLPRSSGSAPGY